MGKEKFTQDFGRKTPRVDWGIFLKLILNKYDRREWTALNNIKQNKTNLSSFLVFNWHSTLMDQCAISSRCIECWYPSSTCTNPLCQCSLDTDSNVHCQCSHKQHTHSNNYNGQPSERILSMYIKNVQKASTLY